LDDCVSFRPSYNGENGEEIFSFKKVPLFAWVFT